MSFPKSTIKFPNLLSEFVYNRTYARWVPEKRRRETWDESVDRYIDYVFDGRDLPDPTIRERARSLILSQDVLPSMRALWCAGETMDRDNLCAYNCTFAPIDNLKVFGEALFILMCGSGFGFSVERQFVNNLPVVGTPKDVHTNYIIQDSTEGWADAVYFAMVQGHAGHSVTYDYSRIRPKGARLRTKGGRASGPEPLKRVLDFIAETLRNAVGRRLKPIECHDILCTTAEIVMVGGFRRSSLISFSDVDDAEMRAAKDWSGGNTFPAIRYMANNSATYDGRPTRDVFDAEWAALRNSGSGERGFLNVSSGAIFRRGGVFRTNPCVTGDTRVMTDRGMERMDAFLGRSRGLTVDTRFGTDGTGLTPTGSFTSGVKAVYKLRTREGYSLRCTVDHKIRTPRGWVPAGELKTDDEILIVNRHGMFGTRGDANIGTLAGWLTGDGSIWEGVPRFYYYGEKRELTQRMADAVCAMTGSAPTISRYEPSDRDTIVVPGLRELLGNMPKDRVPEFVWQGTEECQRAYVSALFSADGSVQGTSKKSGLNLRLSASTLSLLQDIQVLLTNFGIVSKIYEERRPAGYRDLPDGKGGYASVMCAADHELVIGKANVGVFLDRIGFMLSAKQQKAQAYRQNMPKGLRNEKFVARVLDFTYEGDEEVFDLTEATTHSFVANGIVISNCGEIKLRFKLATNAWTGEGGGGQGCNLSAAVMRAHDTIETMAEKVRIATWLGAIQATYTYFPYLRPGWEELCREDRLTGVDITGQCDNPALSGDDEVMAYLNAVARGTAIVAASALKISVPAAITCGKPSGNSSQLVDCASGFHTRYARYYYRHVRISAKDPLFRLIRDQGIHLFPENGQEHLPEESVDVWVARFPVKSPEGAKLREHERAIEQCNRYLAIMRTWCAEKGHNQSATIYVRESEWDDVGNWLYENFDEVSGLSFLPYDESGTKYRLPPYQEITAEEYEKAAATMPDVDFSLLPVYETDDDGDGSRELACVSGACEV